MAWTLEAYSGVQLKASTDAEFRAALLSDPRAALAAEGLPVADGVEVTVIEATASFLPIAIPPLASGELDESLLEGVAGGSGTVYLPGVGTVPMPNPPPKN